MKRGTELQVVTIASPYDSWHIEEVRTLFARITSMRLGGYRAEYPDGVLPFDAADFAGEHHAICVAGDDGWIPLYSHRTTTLRTSQRHGLPFGGVSLARAAGTAAHQRAMERLVARCSERDLDVAYLASGTMAAQTRQDPELRRRLSRLLDALTIFGHHERGTCFVAGGTLRFKMDQRIASWGGEAACDDQGQPLPPMRVPFLLGEEVRLMFLERFTPAALERAREWEPLWERRIELGTGDARPDSAVAAGGASSR